jgi:VanZ family protein
MPPARLSWPLRIGAYLAAVTVLLWLCLAPSETLPQPENVSDKAEHGIAWFVLTALGVVLSPRRWRAVAAFALGLGVAVELLQAGLGFGRHGDWRDLAADSVGVLAALALLVPFRRRLDPG